MNFSEYYKKAWESSLSECTSKLQTELDAALMVIADLKSENARYREALKIVAEGESHPLRYYQIRDLAREALKGEE